MTLKTSSHSTMPAPWRIGMCWPLGPRVEDPVRIKEFSDALGILTWNSSTTRVSLTVLFNELSKLTHAELRYYYKRRKAAGRLASVFRVIAWVFGTLGALAPVIYPLLEKPPVTFLSWGYLAIAVAGAFVVADKVFVGTEGHGRYVSTQLKLENLYSKFALEWQALLIAYDSQPSPECAANLVERAVAYADGLHESLGSETAEWKVTMDKVHEELAKQSKSSSD